MLDLLHGTHLSHRVKFSGPGYEACEGADFVVITAGIPRKPDETRLDLLKKNVDNLRENVLPTLSKYAGNAFIIMLANPADVLTYQAASHGAFPADRVIGTGTLLDSTRLRSLLADRLEVDPRQVYAYMLGEHGDSQYPYLSGATVAGIPLAQFLGMRQVALSLPCVIGKQGRIKIVPPPLSEDEKSGLLKSYNVLREALDS